MATQPKETKYRRRATIPDPSDYGQCSSDRNTLDRSALQQKQDPVELLRKLDELRDQITRSFDLTAQPPPPPDRLVHRMMSRREISLRPSHEPPPTGRDPDYGRSSRFAGRHYGTSLPLSTAPYDQSHRSERDERYARQSSARSSRHYPERQWEGSSGFGQGSRHHGTCQCSQCLQVQGQRAMAPEEEHILMARFFAGQQQQQQGSFQLDKSQSISSEWDRRSLASSSLYSHLSVSKKKVEYFRKKAGSFCRPMKGAAPFVVCTSCCHLLQLPPGKCAGRKKNQVQCGSCSEIVTFKPKQMKVHPSITPSTLLVSESITSSNHRDSKTFWWYQHQDDDDFNFYKLQAHDNHPHKKDFADSVSPSSTASFGRTDSERGSNRSISLNSESASMSRFSDNPKDILCQGDTDSQAAASAHCTVNPQGPILVDKQIDPFSSLRKNYSPGEQTRNEGYNRSSKADCEDNVIDERIDMKSIQKSKEGHTSGLEDECSNQTHEQIGRQGRSGSPEDAASCDKYRNKIDDITSSLEDKGMRKKYDHNSSFRAQVVNKKYVENENDDTLEANSVTERCEQENNKVDCEDRSSKVDCEDNVIDERIVMKSIQKTKEGHTSGLEDECSNQTHEQIGRQGKTGSPEDGVNGSKYRNKIDDITSSLEDKGMRKKYDHNSSFTAQAVNKKYVENENDDTLEANSITERCEQENNKDGKLLHSDSKMKVITSAKNDSSINEGTNAISRVSSGAEVDEIQSSNAKNADSSYFAGFLKKGLKDLSLFSQPADSAKVSINGHPISERALRKAEKKAGPVDPGSYWYDYRAGFWGVFGRECSGIIPPFIKEFNYPMPKDCAGGNTGVFINGRELHQKDFDLLVGRGLPRFSGKSYSVEISGSVIDDTTGEKLRSLGKLAPTIEKMKRGFGMHVPEETS